MQKQKKKKKVMASSNKQQLGLVLILVALVSTLSTVVEAALPSSTELNTCDISEFRCPSKDGQGSLCLPMDRWCNGKDDCDNRVDEPRSCSSKSHPPFFYFPIIATISLFYIRVMVAQEKRREGKGGKFECIITRLSASTRSPSGWDGKNR